MCAFSSVTSPRRSVPRTVASSASTTSRPASARSSVVLPAPSGRAVGLDLHPPADVEAADLGDGDVDLHVLVGRVEDRDDGGTRLRELTRPDELRLYDGRRRGRADRVLGLGHAELAELRGRELTLGVQGSQLLLGEGDRALLGLRAREHLARPLDAAACLVAGRAPVVERLRRAYTGAHEGRLTGIRPLREPRPGIGLI